MTDMLLIDKVKKQYNGINVLNEVSMTIENGEIFGLLGPSGAGKTTLIKILTSQVKKDSGTV